MANKKLFLKFLPYILSIIILFLTIKLIGDIKFSELKNIHLYLFILSTIFYLIIKVINSIRYSSAWNGKPSLRLFFSLIYCNFILSIAPFRTGEISYLYYLKKIYQKDNFFNVSRLLVVRIFDLISITALFFLSLAFSLKYLGLLKNMLIPSILIILLIAGISVIILFRNSLFLKYNNQNKIINLLHKFFTSLRDLENKKLLSILMLSLTYWSVRYLLGYLILKELGIVMVLPVIFLITSINVLIGLLPIQTVAGFGIHEASWTYFLVLFGVSSNLAFNASLAFHFIILMPVIALGIISFILLKNNKIFNERFS